MNDAAVRDIRVHLQDLETRVSTLELKVEFLKGQIKARLKEEADDREMRAQHGGEAEADARKCPTCGLGGPLRNHASH